MRFRGAAGEPKLARALARLLSNDVRLVGDGFCLPPDADSPFWHEAAELLTSRLDTREYLPHELAELAQELETLDITHVSSKLYLGTLSAGESSLALELLRVQGVVTFSCDWWANDGVAQFTVPPNAPIGDGELLADAVNFMRTRSPCLVISDSGADAAAVMCAAMLAAEQGLDATAALAAVEARRGPLPDVTLADLEALANFCATLNTPPAPPRPPPRGPTSPFALPDVVAFPPKKRARSPPSDEEAVAPAHGGGTPKMGFKRAMASQARSDVARALSLEIS